MPGPLEGIRVLDLTTIYSGPICTSILGDQGADIIKIESPSGDWMRTPSPIARNGVNGSFAMMNRNKRSMVIDLSQQEGKEVLKKLVKDADVLVENYRPGVMERLGIGYDVLKAINEKLVFASINGVGNTGPYAHRRIYDGIIQAVSGVATLQADPEVERPILINSLVCDKLTALTASQAISAALIATGRTGLGQKVEVAMLDAALFFLWSDTMLNYTFVGDDVPFYDTKAHVNMIRKTLDGYVCIMPVQTGEWEGLYRALELPNLSEDENYHDEDGVNMDRLNITINTAFEKFTTADIMVNLEAHQVPYSKINSRKEVITDPQVVAMESLVEFEHTFAGPMRQARPPGRFSETPAGIFRHSPELGEHTREVLDESGFSKEDIDDLRARKIVR